MPAYVSKNDAMFHSPAMPALRLRARLEAEPALGGRRLPAEEVADRVGADLCDRVVEADHVPGLRELLAGLGDHPLVRQRALVRRAAFEHDAHEEHRVVPEAHLLAHLRDPLGREALLPAFGIVEVAERRERRDARVEPAVADLGDARRRRTARRARDLDVVDPRPVELGQRRRPAAGRARARAARRANRRPSARCSPRSGRRGAAGPSSACARCTSRPCCASQSSMRLPMCGGSHSTVCAAASIGSRTSSTLMNHSYTSRNSTWLLQRQHTGTLCAYSSSLTTRPASRRSRGRRRRRRSPRCGRRATSKPST